MLISLFFFARLRWNYKFRLTINLQYKQQMTMSYAGTVGCVMCNNMKVISDKKVIKLWRIMWSVSACVLGRLRDQPSVLFGSGFSLPQRDIVSLSSLLLSRDEEKRTSEKSSFCFFHHKLVLSFGCGSMKYATVRKWFKVVAESIVVCKILC